MSSSLTYCIHYANVTHHTVDGEVVIVNLTEGSYYTLDRVGLAVWGLLAGPRCLDDVMASIAKRYGLPTDDVGPGLTRLWHDLIAEQLVIPCEGEPSTDEPVFSGDPGCYQDPHLHKYADLLLFQAHREGRSPSI